MFAILFALAFAVSVGAVVITPVDDKGTILLTPREAAGELRISERTLWGITEPRGPVRKVLFGRCVRYDREQLREDVLAMREAK